MKKEKSCGGIIFDNDGKVLVIRHNLLHWSFPKGHMEKDESELETAYREIFEETHLKVKLDENIYAMSTYSPKEGVIKDVKFFLGRANDNKVIIQTSELCDYAWLDYDDVLNRLTYDDDKDIFIDIYKKYKKL